MADELLNEDERKKLKKLISTAVDLFMKLAPVSPAFKQVHKAGKELGKVANLLSETSATGRLTSTSEELNQLQTLSNRLSSELSKLARQDENYWLEVSGANLYSKQDSTHALNLMRGQREHLLALSEACDGLKALAAIILAASNANIKGWAKMLAPSTLIMDIHVMEETRDAFQNCRDLIDATLVKLERAINATADMTKAIDQAIVMFNNSDQREAVRTLQGGSGNQ